MKKVILITLLSMALLISTSHVYAADEVIDGPDLIQKQYDQILTLSQILELYSSNLGDPYVLTEDYVGNGDVPGIYTVTISVSSYTKDVSIKVLQTLGDVIAVTGDDTIYVYKDKTMTNNEIINTFINAKQLLIDASTSFIVMTNQYRENPNTPGVYLFEFKSVSTDGSEETYTTYIKVSPEDQIVPDVEIDTFVERDLTDLVTKNVLYISVGVFILSWFILKKIKLKKKVKS